MIKRSLMSVALTMLVAALLAVPVAAAEKGDFRITPLGALVVAYTPYNQVPYDETISYPGSPDKERGFRLGKADIGITGRLYFDWLSYKVVAGAEQTGDKDYIFGLDSAYLRGAWTPVWGEVSPTVGMTVGAMKIPFSRQNLINTEKMQFIRRPMLVEEMPIHYDLGATVDFDLKALGQTVDFGLRVGMFNGQGDKQYANDVDDKLQYVGRVQLDFLQPPPPGEGATNSDLWELFNGRVETPHVGLGYAMLQNNALTEVVKSWEIDAAAHWHGLSVSFEYMTTRVEPIFGEEIAADNLDSKFDQYGWYVQGGIFFVPRYLEAAARYQVFTEESLQTEIPKRSFADGTIGLNFHLVRDHRAKFMANYVIRRELEGLPILDNDTVTLAVAGSF
jgi:hypothetical protein